MPNFKLLITDLDNTLYDWVSFFVPAFEAMIDAAIDITHVDRERLLDEMRAIHVKYQNSEEPYALLDAESLHEALGTADRSELADRLDPAFHAFNKMRAELLRCYDGVRETLHAIQSAGIPIVGHTEARVWPALFRLDRLELADFFRQIYLMPQLGPGHPTAPRKRLVDLEHRLVTYLPREHRKPHPETLLDICEAFQVRPADAFYVGDSVTRDIYMANRARVRSGYAAYGTRYDPRLWTRLVRVTHWTPEDVTREQALKAEAAEARPSVSFNAFSELLAYAGVRPVAAHVQS